MILSIVTITYDNLKGLRQTALSITNQTHTDYEWIVIDGGSTDGTVDYINTLDRQPDYFCSEPDKGIYDALNKGISHATGKYVCCMNAGDWFYDRHVLKNIYNQLPLDADVIYGDWITIEKKDNVQKWYAPQEMPAYYFFFEHNLCHQAMFVRTRLLQASLFDVSYKICADWKKWQQFMLEGKKFQYIPVLVCVHDNQDGASSNMDTPICKAELSRLYSEMPKEIRLMASLVKKDVDKLRYKNNKHLLLLRKSIILNALLFILSIILSSVIFLKLYKLS